MSDPTGPADALTRLEVLVGQWAVELDVQDTPVGAATIEWTLDHRFLIWQVTNPDPRFPDSLSIVSVDADGKSYTQHYFDTRGVVRIYQMTLRGETLTLLRDEPDFTPLEFSQRFTATIADGGDTIRGMWETARGPGGWEKDFGVVYRKMG